MAVGFLITRLLLLLFFLLRGMNCSSVFSTAESMITPEMVQKVKDLVNEQLRIYQKKNEALGPLMAIQHLYHQSQNPIQKQPQASVKLSHEVPQRNGPHFNIQEYIGRLLSLPNVGSVNKDSDGTNNQNDGVASSRRPNRFQLQDLISSSSLSGYTESPKDHGRKPTPDSNPHFRLSLFLPGAHNPLNGDSIPEGIIRPSDKMEPGNQHSQRHPHPVVRNHFPQDHHQQHGRGHHWPLYPLFNAFGQYSPQLGNLGTSHHQPQPLPQLSISHDPGKQSIVHYNAQSSSQRPSSYPDRGHYSQQGNQGDSHHQLQPLPQPQANLYDNRGHYSHQPGTFPHKLTPLQWSVSRRLQGHQGTSHSRPRTGPLLTSSHLSQGHRVAQSPASISTPQAHYLWPGTPWFCTPQTPDSATLGHLACPMRP